MRFVLRSAAAVLVLPLVMLAWGAPAAAQSDTHTLKALNDAARAAYAVGRAEMLEHHGPVIIVSGDITLLKDGQEVRADYTPDSYDALKTVAHLTLGVVGLLQAYADDPAAQVDAWRLPLETLQARAKEARPILADLGLGADALARNQSIMDRMIGFADQVLADGTYTRDGLTAAARDVSPYLLGSAVDAARAQIDGLDTIVRAWKADMTPEEWDQLMVLVLGPRMPRNGYLQFAYFRSLMGEEAVDHTLIYGENIFDQKSALDLLGTVLQDRSIGRITFDDEMRMDRDLLADASQAYLLELFGKLGRPHP